MVMEERRSQITCPVLLATVRKGTESGELSGAYRSSPAHLMVLMGIVLSTMGCEESDSRRSRTDPGSEGPGLIRAACMDDEELAKRLIDEGADVNELDSHGRATPLGVAASAKSLRIVCLLIKNGADVNKACPLYYAAGRRGNADIVRTLLEAGAKVNSFRMEGVSTPILAAGRAGDLDIVKLLREHGSALGSEDKDFNLLREVAASGHASVVEYLLSEGMEVDAAPPDDGLTALHIAARGGHAEVVRILLKSGANTALKTKANMTAVELARENGHELVIQILEGQ